MRCLSRPAITNDSISLAQPRRNVLKVEYCKINLVLVWALRRNVRGSWSGFIFSF